MRFFDNLLSQWQSLSTALKISTFILVTALLFENFGIILLAALCGWTAVWWLLPYARQIYANWNGNIQAEKFVSRNIIFTYQTNHDKHTNIDLRVTRIWASKEGVLMISGFYHNHEINIRFRAGRMFEVEDIDTKVKYESGLAWAAVVIENDTV